MSEFNKGDRVRVVIEGEVAFASSIGTYHVKVGVGEVDMGEVYVDPALPDTYAIEKVEPPIVQFGPGDVVRHRLDSGSLRVLGQSGYIILPGGEEYDYSGAEGGFTKAEFTSDSFERVEVGA